MWRATCCVHIVRMVGGVYFPSGGSGQGGRDGAGGCQLQPWPPTAPRPARKAFLIRPWVSSLEPRSSIWQTPLLLRWNLPPTCPWPPCPIPHSTRKHTGSHGPWGLICFPPELSPSFLNLTYAWSSSDHFPTQKQISLSPFPEGHCQVLLEGWSGQIDLPWPQGDHRGAADRQ